jgi:hypothetical protein
MNALFLKTADIESDGTTRFEVEVVALTGWR